jgi:hypothetical protein
MKNVAIASIMALLLFNVIMYPMWVATQEDDDNGWIPGNGDDDIVPIDAITVTVPPVRAGDIMQYDYEFFAEIYDKNKTSGNWSRITLKANGQLLEQIAGTSSQRDGYNRPHDSWQLHTELSLSMTITAVEFSPGEDNEPLIITGRITAGRDRYATLKGDVPILTYAGGLLAIDEIKGLDLPVSNFEFNVDNWAYPDPAIDPERSLEEQIYGDSVTLTEGMNGSLGELNEEWNYTQYYNWSIDRSERVRGYDCARLNISLDFFGFITLDKLIWLSSDVPRPVAIEYNSTTFWDEENETGHLIFKTSQMLEKNGYTKGGTIVPIDLDAKEVFIEQHTSGVYEDWDMVPADGGISSSSFDLGLEEALDLSLQESSGLNDWLRTHPSPMVTGAGYWAEEIDVLTTEYTWNITLEDERGDWETWEDWGPTNGYSVNVTRRVEQRIIGGPQITTSLASEYGPHWGAAEVAERDLSDKMITLASSEDIWATVSRVAAEAYSGLDQEVDFKDARYFLIMGGIDSGGFGLELLDTLTGITVPTSNYSWSLQLGNVWEGASTYAVAVDAETGRMVLITSIEGPQSLSFILGNL